jgi:hypothetical protein
MRPIQGLSHRKFQSSRLGAGWRAPCSGTAGAARARGPAPCAVPLVLLDLDSVVAGLEDVVTAAAFDAARATWPTGVVGRPSNYSAVMAQLLPAVEAPEEAAMLIRLLADEGIIGETSARAGRCCAPDLWRLRAAVGCTLW